MPTTIFNLPNTPSEAVAVVQSAIRAKFAEARQAARSQVDIDNAENVAMAAAGELNRLQVALPTFGIVSAPAVSDVNNATAAQSLNALVTAISAGLDAKRAEGGTQQKLHVLTEALLAVRTTLQRLRGTLAKLGIDGGTERL